MKFSSPKLIRVGNGDLIPALGEGNINILAFNSKKWIDKFLTKVLYVPEIHLNLFSMSRTLEKGYTLESNEKRCVLKRDGDIVAVGERQVRLYKMLFKVIVSSDTGESASAHNAVGKDSLKRWHE